MQPGYPGQPPQINNNMTMSVVGLILFWPLAIPALINAGKVNPLLERGNYHAAQLAADESRKWSRLAIIVGLIWYAIMLVCCVVLVTGSLISDNGTTA